MPPGVTLTTLDNGLVIIMREDHSAPVVSAQAWCMTGSIHEGKWLGAGLSHVLEHMLFKGTTTRPGSRIDQEVQEAGGYMNAYTSFDRTVYHINVPNTGAPMAIDILCDIMQNATLPPEELDKELDVIRREMDMNQDDPGRRAGRRLFEVRLHQKPLPLHHHRLPGHFQRAQAGGHPRLLPRKIRAQQLLLRRGRRREDRRGGRANPSRLRQNQGPRHAADGPAARTAPDRRRAKSSRKRPSNWAIFILPGTSPNSAIRTCRRWTCWPSLLGSGRSSRLFQQVREKKGLVTSADAWTYSPGEPGLFGMSAVVDGGQICRRARRHAGGSREASKCNVVSADELAKVVKQFIAATLATRKTMQGQAQDLGGNWMAANDLNFSERYLAAVKRVTPPTSSASPANILTPANRTLYALLPQGAAPKARRTSQVSAEHPHPKNRLAQRPAAAGQGGPSPAVCGISRRLSRRRAGRNRARTTA